jgi:hypothetical protein
MSESDWIPPEVESVHGGEVAPVEEVIDGLPVLADVRELAPPPIVAIPAVQAIAAAATGFIAGAATLALARRYGARKVARMEHELGLGRGGFPPGQTRRYLVRVYVLGRPDE